MKVLPRLSKRSRRHRRPSLAAASGPKRNFVVAKSMSAHAAKADIHPTTPKRQLLTLAV